MEVLANAHRAVGLPGDAGAGRVASDPGPVLRLLARCPEYAPTPLHDAAGLAEELGVGRLWLKDETARMGLGSFKALGAAYVIARDAEEEGGLDGVTYVAASAGNHGLSLATGAAVFGASAVVYLAEAVGASFERRLRRAGAEVIRSGADYEQSMAAAEQAATENGWRLLSDSSWPGYADIPRRVMEGYLVVGAEIADQLGDDHAPSHVLLQAGVGGMAAALAAHVRERWGDGPRIVVVEPQSARPLLESVRAGRPVRSDGPPSAMGRLDCKEPSHLALSGLARDADFFVAVGDHSAETAARLLSRHGVATSPSGAAGLAVVSATDRKSLGLDAESSVLTIISEGDERAP